MKNYIYLLSLLLSATACRFPSETPEKRCLDLTALNDGTVKFMVNTEAKGVKPGDGYQRNYLIQVYGDQERKKLMSNLFLGRKLNWEFTLTLEPAKRSEYCIVVYKDRLIGGYEQMD